MKDEHSEEVRIGLALFLLECPICGRSYAFVWLDDGKDPVVSCVCGYSDVVWSWPYDSDPMEIVVEKEKNGEYTAKLLEG